IQARVATSLESSGPSGFSSGFSSDTSARSALHPERTAIHRTGPSAPAKALLASGQVRPGATIRDFGCGYGADAAYFAQHGLHAHRYDPYHYPHPPRGTFDWVFVNYVVNVLPYPAERVAAIHAAASYLAPGGIMVITARNPADLATSRSRHWRPYSDGFVTSQQTFQRAFTTPELEYLAAAAGLATNPWTSGVSKAAACFALA
uniref:methyltransferase domain-containing protein n=1 Tax=uncultured Thiodictyon sp. TaxID=1846217 RepID=UPI0025E62AF4